MPWTNPSPIPVGSSQTSNDKLNLRTLVFLSLYKKWLFAGIMMEQIIDTFMQREAVKMTKNKQEISERKRGSKLRRSLQMRAS
jgi:hypothetical protein